MALHTVGLVILWLKHEPLSGLIYCGGQPARSVGAATPAEIIPIPEADKPISVRNRPIPTPLATLIDPGIMRTSHCLIPIKDRNTKTHPSMNTAVSASR
jgi:hypothetical protein